MIPFKKERKKTDDQTYLQQYHFQMTSFTWYSTKMHTAYLTEIIHKSVLYAEELSKLTRASKLNSKPYEQCKHTTIQAQTHVVIKQQMYIHFEKKNRENTARKQPNT